jgi:hypothetical protein
VREAVAFLLLACACGAATLKGRADDARRPEEDPRAGALPGAGASGASAGEAGGFDRGFAGLEGRAAFLAPGLRLAAERENAGESVELVRALGHDVCVRVAFQSAAPVTARLLDGDGGILAETQTPAADGALGDRGPVCVRKGETVSAAVEGPGGRVKWIAWTSP